MLVLIWSGRKLRRGARGGGSGEKLSAVGLTGWAVLEFFHKFTTDRDTDILTFCLKFEL